MPNGVGKWFKALDGLLTGSPKIGLAAVAVLLAVQIASGWHPGHDASSYLSIARSVASGQGPTHLGNPHLMYAPGYALLMSPLFLAGDRPFLLLSIFQWAAAVGLMLGVYRWAQRLAPQSAIWIAVLSMVNAAMWIQYRRTHSDIVFGCVLIWAVHFIHQAVTSIEWRRTAANAALAALLMSFLPIIRPAGITLVAGTGTALMLAAWNGQITRRRAAALVFGLCIPACLPLLGFLAHERYTSVAMGEKTNLDWFGEFASQFVDSRFEGLRLCISDVGRVTLPGMFKSYGRPGEWLGFNMWLFLPFFLVFLSGWWRLARRHCDPLVLMFPFYFVLHTVWGIDQGARYFVPLVPLLMVCLWYAFEWLGESRPSAAGVVLAAHLAVAVSYWLAVDLPRRKSCDAYWPEIDLLAATIQDAPGPVLTQDWQLEKGIMLQLAIDRRVHARAPNEPLAAQIAWLITPLDGPAPDGFVCRQALGDCRLWGRPAELARVKTANAPVSQ